MLALYLLVGAASLATSRNSALSLKVGAWGSAVVSVSSAVAALVLRGPVMQFGLWPLGPAVYTADALSAFFAFMVGIIGALASVYAYGYLGASGNDHSPVREGTHGVSVAPPLHAAPGASLCLLSLFPGSMQLVLLAGSTGAFMLAWEAMALTSFLLVVVGGGTPAAARAGFVYLVMTHLSAAVMLIGFLTVGAATGTTVFSAWVGAVPALGEGLRSAVFVMLVVGFATKAGLVPFHIWLPKAHPEAPGYVSALMSGVMVKVAMYALLRFAFTILGTPAPWWGGLLVAMGLVSAILGGLAAQSSHDTKGVLAYSTIENMGILAVALGLALAAKSEGHPAFVALALAAFALHAAGHAVYKTLLFMGAGAVQQATGTRDLGKLGGLVRTLPSTAGLALVGVVAICAVPGLAGFPGEWALLVCAGRFFTLDLPPYLRLLGYASLSGLALTAGLVLATFARFYGAGFLGLPRSTQADLRLRGPEGREHARVGVWMHLPMCGCALLCGVLGVAPALTLRLFSSAAKVVLGTGQGGANVPALAWSGPLSHWWLLSVPLVGAVALAAVMGKARAERASAVTETWNCGSPLEAQMQYSPGGFSQPFTRAFRFRPFVERRMYKPVSDGLVRAADGLRRVQSGSVNAYMAYVLVTLLVLIAAASRMH